ncbi:MAG: GHKL domain-containing protein [Tissierellia bacterium]|nr:GHKL domain-containing protein [Tissierellia bacterium]MDD4439036.1 GHKL domain-containing protein [Tissierellia bacterium]
MSGSYTAVYLITNVFAAYTLFRYMCIFFDRKDVDKRQEFMSYSLYFCIISLLYLSLNNPAVNIASNLIMFFMLTYNYQSTTKTRLIAVVSTYMILMIIEVLVMLILQNYGITVTSGNDAALITGLISIRIFSYIFMLFMSNFKMISNDIKVSNIHWLSIFIIPVGTLILVLIMISMDYTSNVKETIISIMILLVINVFVFYFYDELMKSYESKIEKALLRQQNNAYLKQLEIINQSKESIKTFRHDVKNHALTLKYYIDNHDRVGATEYLDNIFDFINNSKEHAKSGNSEIDSLINYKTDLAEKHNIKSEVYLAIPHKLNINPFDLSIVIGNLLDNAIEAALQAENKFINISVELDRNVLYISISNSYDGKLKLTNNKLETTKDNENHGVGISSVQKSIEKYNGTMNIHYDGQVFYVDALMYN